MNEQDKKSYFLLCRLCYWCASYVNIVGKNRITKCYKFNYAGKRRNSLEFGLMHRIDLSTYLRHGD
jgi:hypothetical protein